MDLDTGQNRIKERPNRQVNATRRISSLSEVGSALSISFAALNVERSLIRIKMKTNVKE